MINLIRNELYKIFHKKAIYILAIITFAFALLNIVIVNAMDSNNLAKSSEKVYINMLESSIKNYDLNDQEQASWYIEEKTQVDVYKASSKYEYGSWQDLLIDDKGYDLLYCSNEADVKKDTATKENCDKQFEQLLADIENNGWRHFVESDIATKEAEIATFKSSLSEVESSSEKKYIETTISKLEYEIEGLKYRLDNDIPYSLGTKSSFVDNYVSTATTYLEVEKDESTYKNRDELLSKRAMESEFYVNKYKMDNKLLTDKQYPANEAVVSDLSAPVGFAVIIIIMIAGSIVAEEYNKGTIKQLLLKPYSRTKILTSKYLATIIVFILFLAYYVLVTALTYGIASGFDTLFNPYVVYNFNTHAAVEMNVLSMIGLQTLSVLPEYLILLTLAFFMSTVTGSSAFSITVPLLVYFFSSLINAMITTFKVKALSFFPTMCWNFSEYLFGGMPSFEYSNMGLSIVVSSVIFLILLVLSYIVFKNKNIKNQ